MQVLGGWRFQEKLECSQKANKLRKLFEHLLLKSYVQILKQYPYDKEFKGQDEMKAMVEHLVYGIHGKLLQ